MKGKYLESYKCPKCGCKVIYTKDDSTYCSKCDSFVLKLKDIAPSLNEDSFRYIALDTKRSVIEEIKYWKWKNKLSEYTFPILFNKLDSGNFEVVVCSNKPGLVIGLHGRTIDALTELLLLIDGVEKVSVKEVYEFV